jgi:hypothetical protein
MRIRRSRGVVSGLAILLLGAWGGLIAFVGPYFGYQMGSDQAWVWTSNRLYLELIPGAVAALGGLILLAGATRPRLRAGAWLAMAAGAWFVIGPTISMLWENGRIGVGPALGSTGTQVLEWVGFFYGSGALIIALAAYGIGMLTTRPAVQQSLSEPGEAKPKERAPRFRRLRRRRRGPEEVQIPPAAASR